MSMTAPYSKKQVQRAGQLLREVRAGRLTDAEDSELWAAIHAVDWWRARHARPLARTNAGLRYYVDKAAPHAQVNVTQRLKRFLTIVNKLERHPTMKLTNMEDIGGVRAVLMTQDQVDFVVQELRRQARWNVTRVREYVSGRDRVRSLTATGPSTSPSRRTAATSRSSSALPGRTRGRSWSSRTRAGCARGSSLAVGQPICESTSGRSRSIWRPASSTGMPRRN